MPLPRTKTLIILACLLLAGPFLTACSTLRLGYGNGPQLAWWWVDGYFDFSSEQRPAVRRGIDRWFEWHRATQLSGYGSFLAQAQQAVVADSTPALACQWQARTRELLEPALQRAIDEFAELVPLLREPQFAALERKHRRNLDEMRSEFLQADALERRLASVERAVDRAERLYGRLGAAQRRVVEAGVNSSPFDPEAWLQERQRRQRDLVQTLRQLVAERADREARVVALRALVQRSERSPDPAYRAYQVKLAEYNCALAAQLHNATTAAQRQKAREQLKGWEDDLRSLLLPA